MRVVTAAGAVDLGTTEVMPTIGMTDYSRRVTDAFGVTTVVERGFARRMSVRLGLPTESVDAVQSQLAELRATSALWIADDRFSWLAFEGFYKDFELDLALPTISYCRLTVEGLAETEVIADSGGDPAPPGQASTLRLVQPGGMGALVSSSVPETDYPEWSGTASYGFRARVIKVSTHRIYESVADYNSGNDPATAYDKWIDIGPTNRWAMFDESLGTATTAAGSIVVKLASASAVTLLDMVATDVRVQATGYDQTQAVSGGSVTFIDLPASSGQVTITVTGTGQVSVGTLIGGTVALLGVTEASPTAGIRDFSRKEVDDFGEVSITERAWAKRMTARALIRTDEIDKVANRIAAVRAKPSLWIGDAGLNSLTIYGFFREFSIEVGETVSKLSLTIEGLSKAPPIADPDDDELVGIITERYPAPAPTEVAIGSIYFDSRNHPYRFEGLPITFGSDQLTFRGDPLTGPGYVSVQDDELAVIFGALESIDDDGALTIDEKIRIAVPENARLEVIYLGILDQASALGLTVPALIAARSAWVSLRDSLVPAWNDISQVTPIVRSDWDAVLNAYRVAIEQARKVIAAPAAVSVIAPANQLFSVDGNGQPVPGQFPINLVPVVKRGLVDIRDDDDVSYQIAASNVTATVNNAAGDPAKGTITVTAAGEGFISLTVTVAGVARGPFQIGFATKKQSARFGDNDSGGIIFDNGVVQTWRSITVPANAVGISFTYGGGHQYGEYAHAWISGGAGTGDAQINNPFVDYNRGGDALTGAVISQARNEAVPCKLFAIGM